MLVESLNVTGTPMQPQNKAADNVDAGRKQLAKGDADVEKSSQGSASSVQPEEILDQIQALTEDGLYSVRFEKSEEFNELIVKVVDTETDEVIRQVPAEEVLGMKASLEELRGQLVNTVT